MIKKIINNIWIHLIIKYNSHNNINNKINLETIKIRIKFLNHNHYYSSQNFTNKKKNHGQEMNTILLVIIQEKNEFMIDIRDIILLNSNTMLIILQNV